MINMTLQALRNLVADDAYATSHQSMAHYRGALLRQFDSLATGSASGDTSQSTSTQPVDQSRIATNSTSNQEAAVAAIQFALEDEDGFDFLSYWNEGEFDVIRRNWENLPEAVFIGADPLHPATRMASGTLEAPQTAAARDVLAERQRQVEVEGWSPERDDQYEGDELSRAAACYAISTASENNYVKPLNFWPWDMAWWKPQGTRRNLVKAGALILADIERLDRAAQLDGGQGGTT